ncbi:MAG: hypothetical protein AAGD40_06130, partial [Pseudomonadota bacterium]
MNKGITPPVRFWISAAALTVWHLIGCATYLAGGAGGPATRDAATPPAQDATPGGATAANAGAGGAGQA